VLRTAKRFPVSAMVAAAAVAIAACGGDDAGDGAPSAGIPSAFEAPTAPPGDAREGGELTVVAADDIDFMDPAAAYYQFTYMVTSAAHRTLLSWQPGDREQPSPDLASSEPEISDDGLEITFTLRDGVRFSPPVEREVTSADVKYAIERGLLPGVGNPYIGSYLADVVGYEQAEAASERNPSEAPELRGITTPDERTLVIELERPTAAVVIQALSLPLSAPVPEEYAATFDAESPSEYGGHVVFTGPYMVENDADGELTGYEPGREISLVRNPTWDPDTDFRPAYLDSIRIEEGFSDAASASRRILDGSAQVNGDIMPPPAVIQDAAESAEGGQLVASPSGGNRYIAINTQAEPFDDIDVRRAVLAAADRTALRNTRGGELVGPVASHFIPPDIPGFEEAGGLDGPDLDFLAEPGGDLELAAEYMRAAGYESGRCQGTECEVTLVGDGASPSRDTTEVFAGTLEELGFDVEVRNVARDVMFTRFCTVPDQQPEICPSGGWLKDFNDAQSILQAPFSGDAILDSNNANWSQLDVPEINRAIDEATLIDDPEERARAWGRIDSSITAQAPAVPYAWDNQVNVRSADVAGVINLFNANWDLAHTSLEP